MFLFRWRTRRNLQYQIFLFQYLQSSQRLQQILCLITIITIFPTLLQQDGHIDLQHTLCWDRFLIVESWVWNRQTTQFLKVGHHLYSQLAAMKWQLDPYADHLMAGQCAPFLSWLHHHKGKGGPLIVSVLDLAVTR